MKTNNFASLMNCNNSKNSQLKDNTLYDLKMHKIFPERILKFLIKTCDEETILHRQKMFKCFEEIELYQLFSQLKSLISSLEKEHEYFMLSKLNFEKLYFKAIELKLYFQILNKITEIAKQNKFLEGVFSFWNDAKYKDFVEKYMVVGPKLAELLTSIAEFNIEISDGFSISSHYEGMNLNVKIEDISKKLGIDINAPKKITFHIDKQMDESLCMLFSSEIKEISMYLKLYDSIEHNVLFEYIAEIDFYLTITDINSDLMKNGIEICYPSLSKTKKYYATNAIDVTLCLENDKQIVSNDIFFSDRERFFYLVGANGGGKTTYLRTVGINLILFLNGCPIYAKFADIYPFEKIYTHFPKNESATSGRFDLEISITEQILKSISDNDFVLFNETYGSTDAEKAFHSIAALHKHITDISVFGIYVTHFHEVKNICENILTPQINESNERLFKIYRSKGSNSSYAIDILKKYGLDKQSLEARLNKDE